MVRSSIVLLFCSIERLCKSWISLFFRAQSTADKKWIFFAVSVFFSSYILKIETHFYSFEGIFKAKHENFYVWQATLVKDRNL